MKRKRRETFEVLFEKRGWVTFKGSGGLISEYLKRKDNILTVKWFKNYWVKVPQRDELVDPLIARYFLSKSNLQLQLLRNFPSYSLLGGDHWVCVYNNRLVNNCISSGCFLKMLEGMDEA